ncbi:MAG: hypothetical protein JXR37_30020 [Kiritimatiellae bacterium]|nr:hypothetical protein [Kiritimatiellia bacterium]
MGTVGGVLLGMLVFFLLYVLSVGPAVVLMAGCPVVEPYFYAVYAPLVWLGDQVPWLGKALGAYADQWLRWVGFSGFGPP